MQVALAYETQTQVINDLNSSSMAFATNVQRQPVQFRGRVVDPILMRQLMLATHEVIIGDYRESPRAFVLDPVITVHPDELFFEAFSTDGSSYVRLSAANEAFEIERESIYGTTNIDFTFALRSAIETMRSSRRTHFTIGRSGFAVQTTTNLGTASHFEQKVDLPDSWVKGFLQVQSALTMAAYSFHVRPVDLLSVIRYFMDTRVRKPPTGMRYVFKPGEAISVVLEPWEKVFFLKDTASGDYARTVRVWGRRRLEVLLRVLPYADKVTIGVLGRGLPHFYICRCGPYKFTLVLSGWAKNDWSSTSALDLLAPQTPIDGEAIASVYNALITHYALKPAEVEQHTLLNAAQSEAALFRLCREGRAMYDPVSRRYRSRELFAEKLDWQTLLAPDLRIQQGQQLAQSGAVTLHSVAPSETRKHEIRILGSVAGHETLVAVDRDSRVRFAQCDCNFFREHLMSRGPCEHILATRFAADPYLTNLDRVSIME